eukprot:COSAG02_NODE_8561_length_2523_cov_1.904290_1_plen_733_part_00
MLAQPLGDAGASRAKVAGTSPKAGFLLKQSEILRNWEQRWFVIENTVVGYYQRSTTSGGTQDTRKGEISLSGALAICPSTASGADPAELEIVTNDRTYRMRAQGVAERDQWLATLTATATAHGGLRGSADDLARRRYCTISCRSGDLLVVTHCPPELAAGLQAAIEGGTLWEPGLQRTARSGDEQTFKLKGNPWRSISDDAVHSRLLMCGILESMAAMGWELMTCADLCRDITDCDTFLFKASYDPGTLPQSVFALSTHETDKIRLVNTPVEDTERLKAAVRTAVAQAWPKGIQREQAYGGCPEFKIKGTPFRADGADAIHVRHLIIQILSEMGALGYRAVTSSDISKKENETDTIFFQRSGVSQPPAPRAAVMLAMRDTIRLINGPPELQHVFQTAVQSKWSRPVQKIEQYYGALSIKLKGNPWWSSGAENVESRTLVCHVLAELARCGWDLELTSTLSRIPADKSTFFLVQKTNALPPQLWQEAATPWCISFNETDRVRLISAPPSIVTHIEAAICSGWANGIQDRSDCAGALEFKLKGNPWASDLQDLGQRYSNCTLACALLRVVDEQGYMVMSSGDVSSKWHEEVHGTHDSSGRSHSIDVDSWFIIRRPASALVPVGVLDTPEAGASKPDIGGAGVQAQHGQLPEGVPLVAQAAVVATVAATATPVVSAAPVQPTSSPWICVGALGEGINGEKCGLEYETEEQVRQAFKYGSHVGYYQANGAWVVCGL